MPIHADGGGLIRPYCWSHRTSLRSGQKLCCSGVACAIAPGSVKQVRQFVGFVGYYLRFIQNFAELSEPLVALIRGYIFMDSRKTGGFCKIEVLPPTENDRFILDMDASLFTVGGVLNQIQGYREVVIAYASLSLWLSQWRYCTTRRQMLAAVTMCTRTCGVHSSLYAPITSRSSGCRSFGTEMECWLGGTCSSASSQLPLTIDWGLSTRMQKASLVNVVNVYDRTVRCRRRTSVLVRASQRR